MPVIVSLTSVNSEDECSSRRLSTIAYDDEQCLPSLGNHQRELVACIAAALGSMALGTVIGYTSPAVPDINASDSPSPFRLDSSQIAWIASIISIGGLIGEPIGGAMLDKFGRKTVLMMVTFPFTIGWIIIALASDVPTIYLGRFVTGICCGVIDVAVPVYIAEAASTEVRGFMGSCHELATNVGLLFVFSMGCLLRWNWLAVACCFIPILLLIFIFPMPESPRWLLAKGRRSESQGILTWLRSSGSSPDADVTMELQDIEQNIKQSGTSFRWREIEHPSIYKPLMIVVGLMFFQQFSGYGVIPEYMVHIFESSGTGWNPYAQTAIVGAFGVLSNMISALVVDRAGRRTMLLLSAILMVISMSAMGSFFTLKRLSVDLSYAVWVPFACLVAYNSGVSLGYGPIPFFLASELFPLRARGAAGGLAISTVWLFMFTTAICFPYVIMILGDHGVYWMMTAFAFLGIFFVLVAVPETKGKSLEDIEKRFSRLFLSKK